MKVFYLYLSLMPGTEQKISFMSSQYNHEQDEHAEVGV